MGLAIICDEAWWWGLRGLNKGNFSMKKLLNSPFLITLLGNFKLCPSNVPNLLYVATMIKIQTVLWHFIFFLPLRFYWEVTDTAQKMKFSIKDFFSKCDEICSFRRIWSHLLKKSLMENFMFCAVWEQHKQPFCGEKNVTRHNMSRYWSAWP